MKTIDDYFSDWESHVFGFGYGSGEEHVIQAVRAFLLKCNPKGTYDYTELEAAVSPAVAWLLINTLCHVDIIEYGCSPRFGWLTEKGVLLREYMDGHDCEYLISQTCRDENYAPCYPDFCNCDGAPCSNPFWDSER